jgi:hypothetical protein
MHVPRIYSQAGIYCIMNVVTGKKYLGSSINIKSRIRTHFSLLNNNKHGNSYLQRSFNKHGAQCFIWGVIEFCDASITIEREQYYINSITDWKAYYNTRVIAESNAGISRQPMSKEARDKTTNSYISYLDSIGGKPLNFEDAQKKAWQQTQKKIYEYDEKGNLINEYKSIKEASEKTGVKRSTIETSSLRKSFCIISQTYFRRQLETKR